MSNQKHLTPEERNTIELRISNGCSFKAIGQELGKDCTTISKEVRKHKTYKKSGAY
jgi:IS30 family transposase